ncbi:hypothetical protein QBC35DRAFT_302484 [Podospora australis]|uniref:Uncharacterized protein n=1 Tax=Podospora australis TaxID=1536484 RepID=A0AAN6WP17_9PEZI|nr:hypothetical protein QBC35DRAFT_302484 [Podospora australis]
MEKSAVPAKSKPQSWLRGWWMEVLAMVTSIGCTAGIVGFLAYWDDCRLQDWPLRWLSLPAVLTALATIFEWTSMYSIASAISQDKWMHFKTRSRPLSDFDLFDAASRGGPWDALMLLVKRPKSTASLGALATVLSLAVGTFVQQSVDFVNREVRIEDGRASFPVAHIYNSSAVGFGTDAGPADSNDSDWDGMLIEPSSADIEIQGAVYSGLFRLGSPPMFECRSSNCTWAGITSISLGFATTCADVTDATLGPNKETLWGGVGSGTRGANVTTPGNITLDATYSPTSWQPITVVGSRRLLTKIPGKITKDGKPDFRVTPALARVAVLRAKYNRIQASLHYTDIEVTECEVNLAAYRYSDVVVGSNKLTIGSEAQIGLDQGQAELIQDDGDTRDKHYIVFRHPSVPIPLRSRLNDVKAIEEFFRSDRFVGAIYSGESPPRPPVGMGDAFRSGDIADSFRRMAQSMTNQLRLNPRNDLVKGESIYQVVFIEVRWGWMVLPFIMQMVALMFVAWIVVKSNGMAGWLHLWKDSSVAVLAHHVLAAVEGEENSDGSGNGSESVVSENYLQGPEVQSVEELEKWAKSTWAKLE